MPALGTTTKTGLTKIRKCQQNTQNSDKMNFTNPTWGNLKFKKVKKLGNDHF